MLLLCEQLRLFSVRAQGGEHEGPSRPGKQHLHKFHFLPLEDQLLHLKKNNESSKCDSPCKGACFSSQCRLRCLTSGSCNYWRGLLQHRGEMEMETAGHLVPVTLGLPSSPLSCGKKSPWCYKNIWEMDFSEKCRAKSVAQPIFPSTLSFRRISSTKRTLVINFRVNLPACC